ncbi:LLM class flavin-dependent oxidoreductase [Pseudonocardiaceae bacterium YIM PH 21723]|nr:LLM class flavin-dependent oxidoreductase [Pseudonocardiaceae bacterium YIM PH 21723]
MTSVPLSVLDLAPVARDATATEALRATTELARRVEALGYQRIWVAEHHNMPSIASSSPSVLIAHLAAATSTIRVGSGGVMLPNHAPLVVAEQFGTLEALHPGRIDLGIGRAPGTDQRTALALRRTMAGLNAEAFPQELTDLIGYFQGDHTLIEAVPGHGNEPEIWLLGSSGFSAQLAGMLGLPFSFAHHFSSTNTVQAMELYRRNFQPSARLAEPYAKVAVNVVCADTDERATWLAGPAAHAFLTLRTGGKPQPLLPPEEIAAHGYSDLERSFIADRWRDQAVGSPDTVTRQLTELLARTGADELMLTTMVYDLEDRSRSFELVSEKVAPHLTRR